MPYATFHAGRNTQYEQPENHTVKKPKTCYNPIMQKYAALLTIIAVVIYGIYNANTRIKTRTKKSVNPNYTRHVAQHKTSHTIEELERLGTRESTYRYIIEVINHGSQNLHFKKNEIMEGGFASPEDAPRIAAYVMQLRGEPLNHAIGDGAMFYSSICGGCHGNDAQGTHGAYPDLTRKPLLGIALHRDELKRKIGKP
jgi:cytochrome c553